MWLPRFYLCLLAAAVLWSGAVQRVAGCSCYPQHPQTAFCNSGFTAVVRVKSNQWHAEDYRIEYKVKFLKVFKSTPEFEEAVDQGSLWTHGNSSASCSLHLANDINYVISGNMFEGRAIVSLCNVVQPWAKVVGRQRKAYRQLYRHGCQCEVKFTPWLQKGAVYDKVGGKQCLWESMPGPHECQRIYGVCMRGPAGCSWKPTLGYKTCIKEHQRHREQQRHSKEP